MASLVDDLVLVLKEETVGYDELTDASTKKREAIVEHSLEQLEEYTAKEQEISSKLKNLEKKRLRILGDMAVVLGHDGEIMTVSQVANVLGKQPSEQKALIEARDKLVQAASRMQLMNQQNEILLKQAMEMVEFDLTLFKSMRQAPETANYGKDAYNTGDILPSGGFDAKQ